MVTRFPTLFSPIQIGEHTLENRIVCTGHATAFHAGGLFTDRHLHYYREKTRGGAGMLITEATGVDPTSAVPIGLHNDGSLSIMRRIAAAVHEQPTRILVQITHAGRRLPNPVGVLETVAVAPSAIPAPGVDFGQMMPHELSTQEVAGLVEAFGAAAGRTRDFSTSALLL